MVPGEARNTVTELRRGVVEYCVLALVSREAAYPFDLVRVLGARGLLTSEGTIYPLLARLRREGLVETTWRESDAGPPRRYHVATGAGRAALGSFAVEWATFRDAVDAVIAEAVEGDPA